MLTRYRIEPSSRTRSRQNFENVVHSAVKTWPTDETREELSRPRTYFSASGSANSRNAPIGFCTPT